MEPLLGGKLANLAPHVAEAFPEGKSHVEYALDFLWDKPEVSLLLSGMTEPEQVEANRDYLRTTLLHSLNLARSACALLELGHWQGAVENILYLGLPMVEELVFTGRWKAVNHQNRRRIS